MQYIFVHTLNVCLLSGFYFFWVKKKSYGPEMLGCWIDNNLQNTHRYMFLRMHLFRWDRVPLCNICQCWILPIIRNEVQYLSALNLAKYLKWILPNIWNEGLWLCQRNVSWLIFTWNMPFVWLVYLLYWFDNNASQ